MCQIPHCSPISSFLRGYCNTKNEDLNTKWVRNMQRRLNISRNPPVLISLARNPHFPVTYSSYFSKRSVYGCIYIAYYHNNLNLTFNSNTYATYFTITVQFSRIFQNLEHITDLPPTVPPSSDKFTERFRMPAKLPSVCAEYTTARKINNETGFVTKTHTKQTA